MLIQLSKRPDFTSNKVLFYLGGIGPLFAAVILTYFEKSWDGVISLIRSILDFRTLNLTSVLTILLVSILPNLLSALIKKTSDLPMIALQLSLESFLPWVILYFIVSLVEEIGWRGYALPRLLDSFSPVFSSIIIGFVWALWHIPLFILPGTWQHNLGFMTSAFWSYMFQLIPRSYLMTWVFVRTGNNPVSAVFFHTFVNLSGELFDITARADLLRFGIEILLALILYM
jgi:membrane protease YdiL (CAAX protease family)